MDSFLDLAIQRQSDRAFDSNRAIEPEKLERILQAARIAPSACNAQPWKFIVVNEPELKNKVADAAMGKIMKINHFTKQAPVHIVIVEEKKNISSAFGAWATNRNFALIDIGLAVGQLVLAAEDEGIGSCILGWFEEKKMQKLLNIPSDKRIVLDIVLGYSVQPKREKKRKLMEEVVSYNKY